MTNTNAVATFADFDTHKEYEIELVASRMTATPKHIDTLCTQLGLTVSKVSSALATMEHRGIAQRVRGMSFVATY